MDWCLQKDLSFKEPVNQGPMKRIPIAVMWSQVQLL